MSASPRIIKRYANRKLYDTHQSVYITLEEMAQIIREGQEVVTIDNKTKEDITYRTLVQLLHEMEKKAALNGGNVSFLNRVIRHGDGTFSGYASFLEKEQGIATEETATATPSFNPVREQVNSLGSESATFN